MVETDAPYLTPKNVPGLDRTNVPQNIEYVVGDLAKYMKVSKEDLITNAKLNTERLFGIRDVAAGINGNTGFADATSK